MDRKEIISYLDVAITVTSSIAIFLLPIFFLTGMTDFFIIPKQILVIAVTLIVLLCWAVKVLVERKIIVVASPLNIPLFIFLTVVLVSSIMSPNRYDSLIQSVPLICAIIFAFAIVNNIRSKGAFSAVLSAYILGGAASALIAIVYYFKIYILPIPAIQSQFFSPMGSTFQQLLYLIPIFIFSVVYLARKLNFPRISLPKNAASDYGFYLQIISFVIVGVAIGLIIYEIVALPNKPILLPYIYGFQTAFASISQDASRFVQSLLFGSGYGTFLTDFTRYKLASFNLEQNIWNLSFSFSSSYVLELIATCGILGLLSYLWVMFSFAKLRKAGNPLFAAIFVAFVLSFVVPYSYVTVAALFIIVGIYLSYLNIEGNKNVYEVSLSMVAKKRGMFAFEATPEGERKPANSDSSILSIVVFLVVILLVAFLGYFTFNFASSDMKFAQSLAAAQQNNGQATYSLETAAINQFPYRADYHRIFSQVNLALANSIAGGIKPGSSPSAQVQQNLSTLLQQSINSGRNAVTLAPRTSVNWQNLGVVYRNLIGVGQNADQFAISSINQAIALDPYNPDLYIVLGGIYYQLGQYDPAIQQFQVAINLKRDYANAYYNLGHAYEAKSDLQNALAAYQAVAQLSTGNQANLAKINAEIKTLQDKIGKAGKQSATNITPTTEQTPLSVSGPSTEIPAQKNPIKVSPPPAGAKITPTPQEASPTPAQ